MRFSFLKHLKTVQYGNMKITWNKIKVVKHWWFLEQNKGEQCLENNKLCEIWHCILIRRHNFWMEMPSVQVCIILFFIKLYFYVSINFKKFFVYQQYFKKIIIFFLFVFSMLLAPKSTIIRSCILQSGSWSLCHNIRWFGK